MKSARMNLKSLVVFFGVLSIIIFSVSPCLAKKSDKIKDGSKVKFEYTLTVENTVIESTVGKTPLEYTQGAGVIIPGLEGQLKGMREGDEKKITIKPEDAYGAFIEEALKEFPKASLPVNIKAQKGEVLQLKGPDGNDILGIIWDVKDESIIVNFNHPLAGKTLIFDVKIVSEES